MFSKSCQYAIRAVLYLAVNARPAQKTGAKEIAEALNVPSPFLAKILQQLARHGLVSSSKGAGGGFYLQEQDLQVTLSQIIDCIDGKGAMSACVLGLPVCSSENPCPLHFKALSYRSGLEKLTQGQTVGQLAKKIISKKLSL